MYVSNTARYLGDSKVLAPRPPADPVTNCARTYQIARSRNPQLSLDDFNRRVPRCRRKLNCGENRLPNGAIVVVDCAQPAPRALGSVYLGAFGKFRPGCGDVSTGFLINCWNEATAKGLGAIRDQATFTRIATAFQRLTRPNRLAGWVPNPSGGMRWVNLGDTTVDATGATIPAPAWVVPTDIPPPISIVNQPVPPPKILPNLQPTLPYVTADTLLAAAALPNAPAVVKQAAAQLPASTSSSFTSLLTGSAIAGIPNYVWLVVVFGGLLLAGAGRRR